MFAQTRSGPKPARVPCRRECSVRLPLGTVTSGLPKILWAVFCDPAFAVCLMVRGNAFTKRQGEGM